MEEWEFLPDNKTFLGFSHDGAKDALLKELIVDTDYFSSPSRDVAPPRDNPNDEAPDKGFKDIGVVPPVTSANQREVVRQVFFKKLKENELVDMKVASDAMEAITPRLEPEQIQFGEEEGKEGAPMVKEKEQTGSEIKGKACGDGFGFTLWNWRLTGIRAFCCVGAAAAATICISILGGRPQQKQRIHADDKVVLIDPLILIQ
ncbi:hypothetical protein MUK42_30329 [Musa troglodytarum]|uniref:DUF6821 domain-containing protein n=1 Tax=Musa troglodytarum TaxID=320322 RepID=A0A9E7FEX4_9LILI|nr:hypothetical protein MUK42_30329 [Musa troglodytarum]